MLENGKPILCVAADLRTDRIGKFDIGGSSGEDGEFVVKALEIQLGDDAVMSLLQHELPALDGELTRDQLEFALRQLEAIDIVGMIAAGVRQKNLCRALLDDGVSDRRDDRVARALGRKQHEAVLLADRLKLVLREIAEPFVLEGFPELVDDDDDPAAVD